MKKVLISGGAGFIGYFLTKKLIEVDYEIHLVDNFSRGVEDKYLKEIVESKKVHFYNIDLLNLNDLYTLDNDYYYIFHLAAIVGVKNVLVDPYNVLIKNQLLLSNLIEFANTQKRLNRFVFASTSEVYACTLKDFGLEFPTPESTPLSVGIKHESRNTYMLSKIYGESMCIHSGLPFTIIRPHNFYGPRMGLSHVIPELLKKSYDSKNNKIKVYNSDHKRSFCYITDAIDIIYDIIINNNSINEIYNIGNEKDEVSILEVAKLIIKSVNKELEIEKLVEANNSPLRRCPSMKKASNIIKIKNPISLEDGIKKCNDWYFNYIFDQKGITAQ